MRYAKLGTLDGDVLTIWLGENNASKIRLEIDIEDISRDSLMGIVMEIADEAYSAGIKRGRDDV